MWSFRGQRLRHPDRLPAPRARRLDRRLAAVRADRRVPLRRRRLLHEVAARRRRRPVARRHRSPTSARRRRHEGREGPIAFLNGSAGWGDAAVIVPWEIYRAYGDVQILDELWPTMVALARPRRADGPRAAAPRARGPPPGAGAARAVPVGHRLPLGRVAGAGRRTRSDFGRVRRRGQGRRRHRLLRPQRRPDGPHRRRCSARTDDAAALRASCSEQVRAAWQAEYLDADGRLTPDTQANHVRALAFDLVPDELRGRGRRPAGRADPQGRTPTWAPASWPRPYLLPVLADTGHLDVAYELLLQDTEPSWLVMVDRGATTVWERWNGVDRRRRAARVAEPLLQGRRHLVPAPLHRRHRAGRARRTGGSGSGPGPVAGSPRPRRRTSRRTAGSSRPGGWTAMPFELRVVVPAGTRGRGRPARRHDR